MPIERLTNSEELVMRAIWNCKEEPMMRDILEELTTVYQKEWRPQTISTFLASLCRKHYLRLQRSGKIYSYKVLVSEHSYNREQLYRLYDFLYQKNKTQIKKDLEDLLSKQTA